MDFELEMVSSYCELYKLAMKRETMPRTVVAIASGHVCLYLFAVCRHSL